MGKVVVVTSGKGGVGKTTSTAALGAALAQNKQKVVVVDFDVGLRNLDLVMGAERRVVYDLVNVIQGDAKLTQALIRDKRLETLFLLPASQTRDKDNLTPEGVEWVINELKKHFDWVICDSPAGIERGATLAMRHADVAVVVTNPEVSSVRDSDRIIGLLDSKTLKAERGERMEKHLLLTRYDSARAERGDMLKVDDVLEILSIPLLGIIPESTDVLRASNVGAPVTLADARCAPAMAYFDAARRLSGEDIPVVIPGEKRAAGPRAGIVGNRSRRRPAGRNSRRDRQACADRQRQGACEDGSRRACLHLGDRCRDTVERGFARCIRYFAKNAAPSQGGVFISRPSYRPAFETPRPDRRVAGASDLPQRLVDRVPKTGIAAAKHQAIGLRRGEIFVGNGIVVRLACFGDEGPQKNIVHDKGGGAVFRHHLETALSAVILQNGDVQPQLAVEHIQLADIDGSGRYHHGAASKIGNRVQAAGFQRHITRAGDEMAVGKPHRLASFFRIGTRHAFHVDRAVIEKRNAVAGGAFDEVDLQFRQAQFLLDGIRHPQAKLDAIADRFCAGAEIGKGNIVIGITQPDGAGSGNGFERRRLAVFTCRVGG
ncbi:hypothetical protein Lal_00044826 [Lupinus albus]|nr:hypothetical protein Lal_00044826 [Lupinus albus]